VPIMIAAHAAVRRRRLSWQERLAVEARHQVDPESPLNTVAPGSGYTARELLARMITVSDNIATNLLIERLGMAAINELTAALGFPGTVLRRYMADYAARARGQDNTTTAADMARIMELLARQAIPGWRAMLRVLRAQQDREKIPDHLPAGLPIANKPGELPGLRADVALIASPGGPLVMSIFLDGLADEASGDALIGRLARAIYDRWESAPARPRAGRGFRPPSPSSPWQGEGARPRQEA